jgi:Kef-type K+ transport system membrane component KefB
MLAAAVGIFLGIRALGLRLSAPVLSPVPPAAAAHASTGAIGHVLLALLVILIAARGMGLVFARFCQPPVVGEMIAGIVLGPSLLGRFAPGVFAYLLPHSVVPYISVLAQLGVILYMFLIGVTLDTNLLHSRAHASVAISHASIIAPFLMGGALALWLYPLYSSSTVSFTVFALLLGVAMSITAFPVLARILRDRGLHTSRVGAIALACAAVDDVTAWCLLAFVVSVAHAEAAHVLMTLVFTAAFIAAVLLVASPAARWYARRYRSGHGDGEQQAVVVACVALLVASLATQRIGIQALFGAFLIGVVIPHDSQLARDLSRKLEDLVVVLFLPAFFVFTGLRTQIGLMDNARDWVVCAVVILVAALSKLLSGAAAARLTGLPWRQAASLGALMNARGLVELIVLNIGLDLGVLTPTLFAILVIMAVVTTLMTAPVLNALLGDREAVLMEQVS